LPQGKKTANLDPKHQAKVAMQPATEATLSTRFDPLSPEQRDDPFAILAAARREQPVFYAPGLDLWVVTRHDDVLAVLKDHQTFSSSGALKSAPLPDAVAAVLAEGYADMPYIIEIDPPLHDRIRGLATKAFTPRRIASLEPAIRRIVDELLSRFAPEGEADVIGAFAWPLPLRVLGEFLGLPRDDLAQLHEWGNDWLLVQQAGPLEKRIAHAKGTVALQHYFLAAVRKRASAPTDDLIGALVAARSQLDPPLSDVEIAGLPLDLMVAGHVTVTRAIGSALNVLFACPHLRAPLLDPARAPQIIEEILRLESPAQGLFRSATRDVELSGITIPAGARVMVHFASANRDECVFAEAASLRPDRDDLVRHVAFGKGIHFCIGAPLARLELGIALPALLKRLPNLRASGRPHRREPVFFARGFSELHVAWGGAI
jgi:cytochrome P450